MFDELLLLKKYVGYMAGYLKVFCARKKICFEHERVSKSWEKHQEYALDRIITHGQV